MSRYLPPTRVQNEQIAQAIRKVNGLKTGAYVRVKLADGRIGTASKKRAEALVTEIGATIISETEFQDLAKGPKKEGPKTDLQGLTLDSKTIEGIGQIIEQRNEEPKSE